MRPKLAVKQFVVCRSVSWEGTPGPRTPFTLEGVCHRRGVPPNSEPPFEVGELWSYLRVFNSNAGEATIPFRLALIWNDAPGDPRRVWTQPYERIVFRANRGVVELARSMRNVSFPGLGWYEFRLTREVRLKWKRRWLIVARESILLEK